jgi:hypothetical protein
VFEGAHAATAWAHKTNTAHHYTGRSPETVESFRGKSPTAAASSLWPTPSINALRPCAHPTINQNGARRLSAARLRNALRSCCGCFVRLLSMCCVDYNRAAPAFRVPPGSSFAVKDRRELQLAAFLPFIKSANSQRGASRLHLPFNWIPSTLGAYWCLDRCESGSRSYRFRRQPKRPSSSRLLISPS